MPRCVVVSYTGIWLDLIFYLGKRDVFMPHNKKPLHQIALDSPYYMFTGEEIAELCNVSQNVISRVKAMPDSPFFLNKCRPEWFLEWMRGHPDFQLTKADPSKLDTLQDFNSSPGRFDTTIILQELISRVKSRSKRPAVRKPRTA